MWSLFGSQTQMVITNSYENKKKYSTWGAVDEISLTQAVTLIATCFNLSKRFSLILKLFDSTFKNV